MRLRRLVIVAACAISGLGIAGPAPAEAATDAVLCNGRSAGEWACAGGGYSGSSRTWADRYYYAGRHNCTRYAAHRLAVNGFGDPGRSWGNAYEWAGRAPGVKDAAPAVGAIAHWDKSSTFPSGHVAYVEEVGPDYVVVSEDNWGDVTYRRRIARGSWRWPSRFIHIRDQQPPASGGWGGIGNAQFVGSDALASESQLTPGQYALSGDVRFYATLQHDGNFVLYGPGGRALWHTGTHGKPTARAVMQHDGNFVLYDGSNRPLWHTVTHGHGGSRMVVQDDGNLVIYRNSDGRPTWASNTVQGSGPRYAGADRLGPGASLSPHTFVRSADRRYVLVHQGDGNVVLYGPGWHALWSSGTHGRPSHRLIMQGDGNLVLYDGGGLALWHTSTHGHGTSQAVMQSDGNFVIYRGSDGRYTWASHTAGRI